MSGQHGSCRLQGLDVVRCQQTSRLWTDLEIRDGRLKQSDLVLKSLQRSDCEQDLELSSGFGRAFKSLLLPSSICCCAATV